MDFLPGTLMYCSPKHNQIFWKGCGDQYKCKQASRAEGWYFSWFLRETFLEKFALFSTKLKKLPSAQKGGQTLIPGYLRNTTKKRLRGNLGFWRDHTKMHWAVPTHHNERRCFQSFRLERRWLVDENVWVDHHRFWMRTEGGEGLAPSHFSGEAHVVELN